VRSAGLFAADGFARDTAVLAAGLAASQMVLLAVMPVWSRLYDPEQFAALGLWTAVSSTVATIVLLRYDTVIVAAASDVDALALRRLCIALVAVIGAPVLVAAMAVPSWALDALGLAPLGGWLPLAVVAGAMSALMAGGMAWLNRERGFVRMSAARLAAALTAALLGTALGWLWQGSTGGLLLAQLAALAAALLLLPWRVAPHSGLRAAALRHREAPLFLWPAALVDAVTQQLPLLLVSAWFGAQSAGQFSLAWRVLALPALMLATAAGSVFYQRFARTLDDPVQDIDSARRMMVRTWLAFMLLGALPAAVIMLAGEPLFALVFGDRWREAGVLAAAMAPLLLAMATSSPTSGAIVVLGLQRWAPVFGVAMLVYRPTAFWVGAHFDSLILAIALWTVCEVVAILVYNRLLWVELERRATRARG
jgi:O-antigen/teichoic acid export membrane protein